MKHTISQNRMLLNVKAIADAGKTPSEIKEGEFAVIDNKTELTVKPANLKEFPDSFRFINKLNGKTYFSFFDMGKYGCTDCKGIKNVQYKEYQEPQEEIWKGVIENCSCTKTVGLDIWLTDDQLIRQEGLTWKHRDGYLEVSPKEFGCYCDCSGKSVYENHIMTMLLYERIKEAESPFYDAEVYIKDGAKLEDLEAIKKHIKDNKEVNTDDDDENDTEKLELRIIGKPRNQSTYNDLELNYLHPRGAGLNPYLLVNGVKTIGFEKVQDLVFEVGNGVDLRHEEFSEIGDYTNLLNRRTHDGYQDPELVYQFENGVNYDTITFEVDGPKANRAGEGDPKTVLYLLGAKTSEDVASELKAMFSAE